MNLRARWRNGLSRTNLAMMLLACLSRRTACQAVWRRCSVTVLPARRFWLAWLGCAALLPPVWQACASAIVEVIQEGRAFSVASLHLRVGDTIRFSNEDEFDHQIYVQSPSFTFDSDEAAPGKKLEMTLTAAGTFEVRCHIHPRMRLSVVVDPP